MDSKIACCHAWQDLILVGREPVRSAVNVESRMTGFEMLLVRWTEQDDVQLVISLVEKGLNEFDVLYSNDFLLNNYK